MSFSLDPIIADAHVVFKAAVARVRADGLLADVDWEGEAGRPLSAFRRVVVVGIGKASMAMAGVVEAHLGARLHAGVAVVPDGYRDTLPAGLPAPQRIEILEASHPVPDARSVAAARRMLALVERCGSDDLIVVLLSGGGTALCNDFFVPLDAAQATYDLLLRAGADIGAMNIVRKHLSQVGGGQLAKAAAPARLVALVVSDVVGDDLSVIASGPTVPDPSTYGEALDVVRRLGLWDDLPAAVRRHLEAGAAGVVPETPGPGEACFERSTTRLVGSNGLALAAAASRARALGYAAEIRTDRLVGEARDVGRALASTALQAAGTGRRCLLWGGETTVTVRGSGQGGRNQELALAAALALDGADADVVLLSGGTDGVDGPTDAAGAWATPATVTAARRKGLHAGASLAENDAYSLFDAVGGLVRTGPTHTNVMDVVVALVR